MPLLSVDSRVINVSSAAQAPLDFERLFHHKHFSDAFDVYAQSKLAVVMWTRYLASHLSGEGPTMVAVNPGSLLASKMVKEGGKLIYVTCSILPQENTEQVKQFLDSDEGKLFSMEKEVNIYASESGFDGFYMARMIRK